MQVIRITMPDGAKYDVPTEIIARNRAKHYADKEFDGDIERSLTEDTLPLFQSDDYEIHDWAANNMNWSDVKDHATLASLTEDSEASHQEGWINGEYEIIDKPDGGSADLLNLERLASMPLKAITRSMSLAGASKVQLVFETAGEKPVGAIILLTGDDTERYLKAIEAEAESEG